MIRPTSCLINSLNSYLYNHWIYEQSKDKLLELGLFMAATFGEKSIEVIKQQESLALFGKAEEKKSKTTFRPALHFTNKYEFVE